MGPLCELWRDRREGGDGGWGIKRRTGENSGGIRAEPSLVVAAGMSCPREEGKVKACGSLTVRLYCHFVALHYTV